MGTFLLFAFSPDKIVVGRNIELLLCKIQQQD